MEGSLAAPSLTSRTARAAQWRAAGALVSAGAQFAVGIVLARLLTPADFGIAALAYVVLGFMQPLADLGTANAVVQRSTLTARHIRTAFTCSVIVGLSLAAALALAAPLAAGVMRDARVAPVLRLLSVGIAVRGAGVVAGALLRRGLDFRRLTVIEAVSYVVGFGAVAIGLAFAGYGVWSLAWGGLAQTTIASAGQLLTVRHSMRPLLATRELNELAGFGLASAASACVNYIALNGDYFLVGRLLGAFDLGLYRLAYTLMNIPQTHAAGIISSVMFPAFAQAQTDVAAVRRGFLLVTRLTATIAAPAMAILAVSAPHFVRSVYGPQWMGAVVPLQVFCLAGYFRALYHLGGVAAQSVGRVHGEFWRQVSYSLVVIAGTIIGSRYGILGVAVGVGVAILYMYVATGQLVLNAIHASWRQYASVQVDAIRVAALAGAASLAARLAFESARRSSLEVTVAVVCAAAVPWLFGIVAVLKERDCEPIRRSLPGWAARRVTP